MLRCARDEQRSTAFQRSNDKEEEEQRGEAENVGEGPNEEERLSRLSLSVCRGRLGGAMWFLHLLRLHGKRIGF
jgi:hypothetical protein